MFDKIFGKRKMNVIPTSPVPITQDEQSQKINIFEGLEGLNAQQAVELLLQRSSEVINKEDAWKFGYQIGKIINEILAANINPDRTYEQTYEILFERYKENIAYAIAKIEKDYEFEDAREMILLTLENLGPEFLILLIEPALSTKLDEFIKFMRQNSGITNPLEARLAFISHLGKTPETVYRFVSLNDIDKAKVSKEGFESGLLREYDPNRPSQEPHATWGSGIKSNVFSHVRMTMSNTSSFCSVSQYKDMSRYAAREFLQLNERPGLKPYLYTIRINPFYLIRFNRFLQNPLGKGRNGEFFDFENHVWVNKDNGDTIEASDPGIEEFVEFIIPPGTFVGEPEEINDKIPEFEHKSKS